MADSRPAERSRNTGLNEPAPTCDFCGLPLPAPLLGPKAVARALPEAPAEPDFCCSGCRFAAAVTRESGETGAARWTLVRLGAAVFFSMNVMCFTMALWTRDVYGDLPEDSLVGPWEGLLRALALLFTAPVVALLGLPLAEGAWAALRRGRLTTDLLLTAGVAAAFGYSAISVIRNSGPVYFEVACVILVMVTLGRWLEAQGKLQAGAALDTLQKLLPATVRRSASGAAGPAGEVEIPLEEATPGDIVRVLPGERIPLDGQLLSAAAQLDEQLITGESLPVNRRCGDTLWAGTLLLDSPVLLEVEAPAREGALQRIIDVVRQARLAKGPYQDLTDRVSAAMFPVVAVVALGTVAWYATRGNWEQGLLSGLAVVLVACPCALGLATPLAVWAALAAAARKQVLFRSGEAVERLAGVRALRFDKTGTLTTGEPRVAQFGVESGRERPFALRIAAEMTAGSNHPFSRAIRELSATETQPGPDAQVPDLPTPAADGPEVPLSLALKQIAGRGLVGTDPDAGYRYVLGSRSLQESEGNAFGPDIAEMEQRALAAGSSLTLLGWQGRVRAIWVFAEELRPRAQDLFDWCRHQKLDAVVLTGDHPARGARLAHLLGTAVEAGMLPGDKAAAVEAAHRQFGSVAMVGDGVNDAPALAAADIGIALGCGSDVSRDSAQVCLLSNDLARLPWAIEFSRRLVRTIRGNLAWAFAYNIVGIALACTGRLNPALAALLMVVSSVLVIGAALRTGRLDELEVWPATPVPGGEPGAAAAQGMSTASHTSPPETRRDSDRDSSDVPNAVLHA